ncbi:MAG: LytTR family DNA-binding domain-containing protein [Acidobacteriota bacterium]
MPNRATPAVSATIPTMLSVILADDEKLASDELAFLLEQFPDIEVIATASNGLEAVKLIEDLEPDLVFLDVQMPGLDGMGVIRRLREKNIPLPHFVMATAYDQYAVEAFRWEALDYLLKPVDAERLQVAVDRARKLVAERAKAAQVPNEAEGQIFRQSAQRTKLLVKNNQRNLIVDAQDLIFASIEDGLITIVAGSGANQIEGQSNYRTIEELQSNLDPDTFWRAHRSYLVNINRIKEVVPWFKSSFQLRMDDKKQTEIPVSRAQTKRLRSLLKI